MRSNTFNYSLLAIGVAAVLGLSTTANAAETDSTTTSVNITNQASATYKVSNEIQPTVKSNIVKVIVSEQMSFSLTADNEDDKQGNDENLNAEVAPNGYVLFRHTLTNTGNRTDEYAVTLATADEKYDVVNSTVTYTIYKADGTVDGNRTSTIPYEQANNQVFSLEKEQYIKFTINAKTKNNKGGDTQKLTISTASQLSGKVLTNTDTAFVRLPTFSIVKTITNALDLNNDKDTATYQVVVTNEATGFSTDAKDIAIEDFLPPGLVMATNLTVGDIEVGSNATNGNIIAGNANTGGFKITGIDIPVGQYVKIVFNVKQGGSGTLVPATAINHVTVTDDLDNNPDTDNTLVDSTDVDKEVKVADFYPTTNPETNYTNGYQGPFNKGDDSTLPLLTIKRALGLNGSTFREIAPTSGTAGQVTHQTVITNNGQDVEGSQAGELTFTITDNDGTAPDAINIVPGSVTVTYDPTDGSGSQTKPITADQNGIYDIYTALPNGIKPNDTVTINYKVSSVNAPLFTSSNSTTPTTEETIITLTPGKEGAPQPLAVKDKTTVRGLTLLKTQAIDANCDTTPADAAFVTTDIKDVLPGQCIVYRIQAKNTSSDSSNTTTGVGFDITNIVISDELAEFSNNATYVESSATTSVANGTASNNGTAITTTIATLAPQATETMQFKVKIKTDNGIVLPTP